MPKAIRPASPCDVRRIARAIVQLADARDELAAAGAVKAANATRRALSSADGALRHAKRVVDRTEAAERLAAGSARFHASPATLADELAAGMRES